MKFIWRVQFYRRTTQNLFAESTIGKILHRVGTNCSILFTTWVRAYLTAVVGTKKGDEDQHSPSEDEQGARSNRTTYAHFLNLLPQARLYVVVHAYRYNAVGRSSVITSETSLLLFIEDILSQLSQERLPISVTMQFTIHYFLHLLLIRRKSDKLFCFTIFTKVSLSNNLVWNFLSSQLCFVRGELEDAFNYLSRISWFFI